MLSSTDIQNFEDNGYIVLDKFFQRSTMHDLKRAALKIVDDFDPQSTRSIFSTKSADTNRDDYFLNSADKVCCFFEEDAFTSDGELAQDKALSINKIGHALHKYNPVFNHFCLRPSVAEIARDLGCESPEIRQSMYIFKQPKIGGVIRWHQDATYFFTTPQSVLTFWFAIEDATLENGCLQVHSGGNDYPLVEQFVRKQDDSTKLMNIDTKPWPLEQSATALEVRAGSVVVFNGTLPHFSEANRSSRSRHAFTLHITSGLAQYHKENWIQAEPLKL